MLQVMQTALLTIIFSHVVVPRVKLIGIFLQHACRELLMQEETPVTAAMVQAKSACNPANKLSKHKHFS